MRSAITWTKVKLKGLLSADQVASLKGASGGGSVTIHRLHGRTGAGWCGRISTWNSPTHLPRP